MGSFDEWLQSIGLEQYSETFHENSIDLDVVGRLDDNDLRELGVKLGDRKRILAAVKALELADTSIHSLPTPSTSEAERRQLTVMFCDLVGSTELSQKLDPEALRELMRAYQQTCGQLIDKYDGHVAQYLGDGLMVYFGWPQAHEDDAERAIRAGLEILEAIKQLQAPEPLHVRVGIATGPVVVGETGAGDASVPKVAVGETPNVAARVQGLADADCIVIAESTRHLLGSTFELSDLGAHALKGIAEPVSAWAVIGLAASEGRFEAHAQQLTPLVGRKEELSLVLRRWEQAKHGEGRVVMLSGESGIGKSRMLQELNEHVADEPHIRLRYQCSPYHVNTALYPVIERFEQAAGFSNTDSTADKLDKLEAMLARDSVDVATVAPLFAALLSIDTGERYPAHRMSPQKQKEATLKALADRVVGFAAQEPLLMLFEDAHWIDPTTQELFDLIAQMVVSQRVLLVFTHRPGYQSHWSGYGHVLSLALTRLGRAEVTALVAKVTGGATFPDEVLDQIVAKADGVPLFVEELTKTVIESGLLARGASGFELTGELSSLAIPSTLQDSLMARLDRLPQVVKELAQIGACIGRGFDHALIAAVAPLRDKELDAALQQLVASEVILRKGRLPDASYTFRHALIQDAAYDSLLRTRRQSLHGTIAQVLETNFPAIAETRPQILAQHYALAGMADKAIDYWLAAGKRAAQASADAEAYANLNAGLALLASLPEGAEREARELDLLIALITPIIAIKGYSAPETNAVSERAIELCRQTGQTSRTFPPLYGQWVYNHNSGNIVRARELAADYLELANSQQEVVPRLVGHRISGSSSLVGGSPSAALQHLDQAWALFAPSRDSASTFVYGQDIGVTIESFQAWASCLSGYPDRAGKWATGAVSRAQGVNHAMTLAYALFFSALTAFQLRDRRFFERLTTELEALTDEHRLPSYQSVGLLFQGVVLGWQGQPQEGLEKVEQGSEVMENLFSPIWLLIRAELLRDLGRAEDALAAITEGVDFISTSQEHWCDAELHRVRGELYESLSRASEAETAYVTALGIAREQQARWWELRTSTSLARLRQGQSEVTEARELLAPVYSWFTEGFDTKDLKEAKALLEELAA